MSNLNQQLDLTRIQPGESNVYKSIYSVRIDPFTKRHKLVHNGGFPKLEALY